MSNLFAALDAGGQQRFISEVERGVACACFCPECTSPLIAKHGDEKVWHFAHAAGQERPECSAGAANMMRRIAIEYLGSLASISLPTYKELVREGSTPWECTALTQAGQQAWSAGCAGPGCLGIRMPSLHSS
jgi:Competence protein CoiA-like family